MANELPHFNYFFGNSQGGREASTVVRRHPAADYDGVSAEVPIVNVSSLMLPPEFRKTLGESGDPAVTVWV